MGTGGAAAGKQELTAEAAADRAVPRTPRISPDGRWVVYAITGVGRGDLWLAPVDGSAPPRELAPSQAEDLEPRWARDSGSVFFLSDRAGTAKSQLYRIGLTDTEPERLTDRPGGVHDHVPLADAIVLVAPDGEEHSGPRVRTVRADGSRAAWDTHDRPDLLWLFDLRTGATSPLGQLGRRHVREVAARPDGGALAVLTWSGADREPGVFEPGLHVVDPGTGATRDLDTPALEASSPTWWHDGATWHLAYLGLTPPGLIGGTAVFDDGDNLTADLDICPLELTQVDDGPPLALFAEGLDTTIRRLDPVTRRFTEVTEVRGHLTALSASGETIAVVVSTATGTDDVHAGPAAGPWTRLSASAPELDGIRWGGQERLHYQAADGLALDGLLVLPPGKTRDDGPFPLVTLIHGGPADRYADRLNLSWYPSGQWLAAAGFAVFLPNPRGSVGHGHAFAASVAGDVGGAEFTDVLTGIDLLVKDGVADESRLGIGGGSHGGFFTAWAVTQTDRFAAAVVLAGVIDWPMLAATGDHSRFEAALGGRANSPITHAHRIRTPVLILHGADDTNVPLSQAELLHRALAGKHHEYVVYPGEGHSIRGRDPRIDVLKRSRAWFSDLLA